MKQHVTPAHPHADQEERRVLVDQEERRVLVDQGKRRAQAALRPAWKPVHAALFPTKNAPKGNAPMSNAPTEPEPSSGRGRTSRPGSGFASVTAPASGSGFASQKTPNCTTSATAGSGSIQSASIQSASIQSASIQSASIQSASFQSASFQSASFHATDGEFPAVRGTFLPGFGRDTQRQTTQAIQAIQEGCRAVLAWYVAHAEQTERRQQQKAEDFAAWKRPPRSVRPQSSVLPPRSNALSPPPRPLPLRVGKRTALGRAYQHWDTPEGRLLVQVRLCEAVLLPRMRVQDAGEREERNAQLAAGLGLAEAVAAGWLTGYTVCWQATGRWPRRPVSVQLLWPGGKAQGDRLRGQYGPQLTHLKEQAQIHFNGAQIHFNGAQVHAAR